MSESSLQDDGEVVDNISMGQSMEEEEITRNEFDVQQLNIEENIYNIEECGPIQEEDWKVAGKEKRRKIEKIDISISGKQMLPKKYALALLLDKEKIIGIQNVKYVNAFKVIVTFQDERNADKLISCQSFKDKEWRIQKTWEVNASYGIIRDIDIDLEDAELLECIRKSNESEIISVKRLMRRNTESGWLQSETVRICFKGNSLPPSIKLFNLKVAVEPYIFPVTQCSRCWRYGHTIKLCPSNKIICPKCGKDHPNCEATTFKCVNCKGNHMSLVKSCPVYLKEKKIRELMAEFNCTYKRAITMYVPPFSPRPTDRMPFISNTNNSLLKPMSYASAVGHKTRQINVEQSQEEMRETRQQPSKRKQRSSSEDVAYEFDESSSSESNSVVDNDVSALAGASTYTEDARVTKARRSTTNNNCKTFNNTRSTEMEQCAQHNQQSHAEPRDSNMSFEALIIRIKQIIFSKRSNFAQKIKNIINIIIDWCVSAVVKNFADMSILKKIFDITFNSQND